MRQGEGLPLVSVIMPVRNESDFIGRSVGCVLGQDYPKDRYEILVADGRSTDDTRDIVSSLMKGSSGLRLIDNPEEIVATGFNAALREARGEVIVRVDGHTEIEVDYVRHCVAELERTGADNVGGRMVAEGAGMCGEAIAAATGSRFGVGGARFHYSESEEWVDTVYLGAWRRATFERIGVFDEELVRNQDDEFNYRLRAAGGRILLSPKIRSRYYSRASWKSLWRQYFQYGFWKVRVMQKHPAQMRPRQFAPPAFVATLLVTLAGAPVFQGARILGGIIVASYLLCLAGATVLLSSERPASQVLRLPLAFAILHLSYGSGFLMGLVKFAGRWGDRGTSGEFRPSGAGNR